MFIVVPRMDDSSIIRILDYILQKFTIHDNRKTQKITNVMLILYYMIIDTTSACMEENQISSSLSRQNLETNYANFVSE